MRVAIALSLSVISLVFAQISNAEPTIVVVGSYDSQSKQVTVFEHLLARKFADGGQVKRIYGGYNAKSKKFHLVRAGTSPSGKCMTEVFHLVPTSGSRLAFADGMTGKAWNPVILQKMGPTFGCQGDCASCDPDHGIPEFGEEPGCSCNNGLEDEFVTDETSEDHFDVENQNLGVCTSIPIGASSYSYGQLMLP